VDQLKRKVENNEREFEEFKRQQQEYKKLHEHIMLFNVGGSHVVDVVNIWFVCCFDMNLCGSLICELY
jgi:hypothetical protein